MGGSAGRNGRLCGGNPPAPSEQRILTHSIRLTKDSSPEDLERWREYNRIEERQHDAEFVEYLKTKKQ